MTVCFSNVVYKCWFYVICSLLCYISKYILRLQYFCKSFSEVSMKFCIELEAMFLEVPSLNTFKRLRPSVTILSSISSSSPSILSYYVFPAVNIGFPSMFPTMLEFVMKSSSASLESSMSKSDISLL